MTHRANLAAAATREPFTFFVAIGAIYLAVTSVSILLLGWVEKRYSLGVRRVSF
jgi:arginine/ornithine transport system permease protein